MNLQQVIKRTKDTSATYKHALSTVIKTYWKLLKTIGCFLYTRWLLPRKYLFAWIYLDYFLTFWPKKKSIYSWGLGTEVTMCVCEKTVYNTRT